MTVALAGPPTASFEIKSANLPLVALLLKTADLQVVAQALQQRFGDVSDFFDHDPLLIDVSALPDDVVPDFVALKALLLPYSLFPLAIKGGRGEQLKAALLAGLVPAQDPHILDTGPRDTGAVASAEPALPAPMSIPTGALVIDKPLRSGQQIYAKGRDLVVLAMVNPGAEVIADGHIHVYAPLRGKAIAGARGQTDARIFSLCLEPELMSIAGIYRTSESPLPPAFKGQAVQVWLDGEKLVMQALKA
jgi:septum site-determining protein MinC